MSDAARARPLIALTMGDAAGIGPELIAKLLSSEAAHEVARPFVVGSAEVLRAAAAVVGAPARVRAIGVAAAADPSAGVIEVFEPPGLSLAGVRSGRLSPEAGRAAALCLRIAFDLVAGGVEGVVNAPLNKEAFHAAGFAHHDELEYMQEITGAAKTFTLGVVGSLWTLAVSEHVPFSEIRSHVRRERILECIRALSSALVASGRERPRIAVAALNVHGGEGGLFGREEIEEIRPAIEAARAEGILAEGPVPADTIFLAASAGGADGVVSMYHDQANIARKLLARRAGATLFVGLPVPCGTTAHGTAFDIAGRGVADVASLRDAYGAIAALARRGAA